MFLQHNDMADLERLLKHIEEEDKRVKRNTLEQRRFIIVSAAQRPIVSHHDAHMI